jgi:predicted small metal-binding protein
MQILFDVLSGNFIVKIHFHFLEAITMARKFIDCREIPSDTNCSVAISADSDQELLEAAVQHAIAVHKHEDTPEFRKQLQQAFKEGTPPVERPVSQAM